jgi:hypothetical protein
VSYLYFRTTGGGVYKLHIDREGEGMIQMKHVNVRFS